MRRGDEEGGRRRRRRRKVYSGGRRNTNEGGDESLICEQYQRPQGAMCADGRECAVHVLCGYAERQLQLGHRSDGTFTSDDGSSIVGNGPLLESGRVQAGGNQTARAGKGETLLISHMT